MIRAVFPAILLACLGGCVEQSALTEIPPAVEQVDEVIVRVPVSPLRTLGAGPGPDAVVLEIFCGKKDRAGGVPVSGTLEVLFFDGRLAAEDLPGASALHVEKFPNALLRGNPSSRLREGFSAFFGVSYQGVVPWGPKHPSGASITLVARYVPPAGAAVLSDPTVVAIRPP